MLKMLNKKKRENKGFTLVELVVVIAILAILVGLLAPQYVKYVDKARKSADATNLDEMVRAIQIAAADPENAHSLKDYNGVEISIGEDKTSLKDTDKGVAEAALKSAGLDDYSKTELKYSSWTGNKITATFACASDGDSLTVTYGGDDFAEYMSGSSDNE